LEEDFMDSQGGNDGAGNGGVTFAEGKVGKAASFDGVDDYVDCGSGSNLGITGSITVEAWIYPESFGSGGSPSDQRVIAAKWGDTQYGTAGYALITMGNNLVFGVSSSGNNVISVKGSTGLQINTWYHVVGIYDGSSLKLYLNGNVNPDGINNVGSLSIHNTPASFKIGSYNTHWGWIAHWDGLIDEVAVYNRALNTDEINYRISLAEDTMISVEPVSVDFGTVLTRTSKKMSLIIKNIGNDYLNIYSYSLEKDDGNYSIVNKFRGKGLTLDPGDDEPVEIEFTPKTKGPITDTLIIHSNDPNHNLIEVTLNGNGQIHPIDIIIEFFNNVKGKTLVNVDPNKPHEGLGRIEALLNRAVKRIDRGDDPTSSIEGIYVLIDTLNYIPDTVTGDSRGVFAGLILIYLRNLPQTDSDDDKLSFVEEIDHNTNPEEDDTDSDGLNDWEELNEGDDTYETDPLKPDTDEDGLDDGWESNGEYWDGRANKKKKQVWDQLDAKGNKPDPTKKDVYIEVDWMGTGEPNPHSHRPSPASMQLLVNEFANHDITLHIDIGDMGGGNLILYNRGIDVLRRAGNTNDFYDFKQMFFDKNRRGIFHYCIIGHWDLGDPASLGATPASGGIIDGDDFFIAADNHNSNNEIAASMMHELGHTFGLVGVGTLPTPFQGIDSWAIPFADYPSVMNYNAAANFIGYSDGSHGANDFDDWGNINITRVSRNWNIYEGR
jgi:hypothetical protein